MDKFPLGEYLNLMENGDKDAFVKVYEEYKKPVYTIICRIVGSRETAEDIMQEFFLKLYKKPFSSNVRDPRAWLFASARNMAIDHLRREKGKYETEDIPFENDLCAKIDIERAFLRLSLDEREIVTLHLNCELTFSEISRITALSLPSVYRRYRKALKSMRDYFEGG